MSVAAQNVAPQAVAAPGQTVFPFAWRCDDSTLVTVWVNNVEDGGFNVILNADQIAAPGGTVNRAVACEGGEVVTVERQSPQTQTTNYTRYGQFQGVSVTNVLDKLVMLVQEAMSILGKCVKAARSNIAKFTSLELPEPVDGEAIIIQADPLAPGKFTLGGFLAASKEYLEFYVQQVLSGGGVVQPLLWVIIGDGVNTDYAIAGAVLTSADLYLVAATGVVQEPITAYTIDVPNGKIKFTEIVPLNVRVIVRSLGYAKGVPLRPYTDSTAAGTITGAINGTTGSNGNAVFVLTSHVPIPGYPMNVRRNGIGLTPGVDYTIGVNGFTVLAPNIPILGDSLACDSFSFA